MKGRSLDPIFGWNGALHLNFIWSNEGIKVGISSPTLDSMKDGLQGNLWSGLGGDYHTDQPDLNDLGMEVGTTDCSTGYCKQVQGTDAGSGFTTENKRLVPETTIKGDYAIYISNSDDDITFFPCEHKVL